MLRRTRFVCVSDTHGHSPADGCFKLPAGDVLIHAGDLSKQGSLRELQRTMDWIVKSDFEVVIIVAGNHDVTLDPEFYAQHGSTFHNQNLENPNECIQVITGSSPSIVYLRHESAVIRLTRPNGPGTTFKVFGSPYSQFKGNWAFGYESADADALWNQIPRDADVVVSHNPSYSHLDSHTDRVSVGCRGLSRAMSVVRPLLAVCGHVHESRGFERVRWDLSSSQNEPQERQTVRGDLPPVGSKKQSLVDLTGKKGERLDNGGFSVCGGTSTSELPNCSDHDVMLQRRETCIVNAAIMATSWPYLGGKRFNAPIVVDLDLPVWQSDSPKKG